MEVLDELLDLVSREESDDALVRQRALRVVEDLFGSDATRRALVDAAIDVVATRRIFRVRARPSSRSFVAVDSASKRYVCFDDFCSCPAWQDAAATGLAPVLCKHMLASRLEPFLSRSGLGSSSSSTSRTLRVEEIPDAQYHDAISSRYEFIAS